jgi:DnaJ-class molecular chaperone
MSTHYETLGLTESATQDDIKKAYRSLASKNHPDKGGDTAKFQEIQSAYAAIETPEKRAQYDAERSVPHQFNFGHSGHFNDIDIENLFRAFNNGGNPFAQRRPQRNKDIRVSVQISLAETLEVQKRTLSINTNGSTTNQVVDIEIPRGVHTDSNIKYAGLGDNFFNSLPRGDLYVNIVVMPHPKFQTNGIDLFTTVDIDCLDAIIGCNKEFSTLDNRTFNLTVPKGTQPGTKFKIGGQGLYAMNQNVRGNLYLVTNITIPTNLTETQVEAIRQLTQKSDVTN